MELRQYLSIIWKWLWLIVLGMLLTGGTAYWVSLNLPPVYRASVTLMINEGRSPGATDYTSVLTSERLAKTYAELLTKRPVVDEVIRRLNLRELESDVTVNSVRDTQLIELSVEDNDPVLAAQVANALPQVFIEQNEARQEARFADSKASLDQEMSYLSRDIENTEQMIANLQAAEEGADQVELIRLQNALSQMRNSYSALLSSYEAIRMAETQSTDTIIVAEPAQVPLYPVAPRPLFNTFLAVVVGSILTLGMAFLIEYLDDTVKNPEDVDQALGVSTLGAIARISASTNGRRLITALHPKSPISEAYRILRTNIQFSSFDKPLRTLLITSSNPLEGKSVTVANLGVVVAQAGLSVIIVDTDLRRPVLHRPSTCGC
jgi:capsular polysaccharide biosynthesis protein